METQPPSNTSAAGPWINRVLIRAVLCLTVIACIAPGESSAETCLEDPEEQFYDELKYASLDTARNAVAETCGEAVATDIAVYFCSPQPEDECEDSKVWYTWQSFLQRIYEIGMIEDVVNDMLEAPFDPALVRGIAVFWCSPERGYGCEDDLFTQAWSDFDSLLDENPNPADAISWISDSDAGPFVAELIAASVCGHPTCFAEELALLPLDDLPLPDQADFRRQTKQGQPATPEQAAKTQFYERGGEESESTFRNWICKVSPRC